METVVVIWHFSLQTLPSGIQPGVLKKHAIITFDHLAITINQPVEG